MTAVLALALTFAGVSPPATNFPSPRADLSVPGIATWYRWHPHQAAAGPSLRKALGRNWRGKWVNVTAGNRVIRVKLTDFCACGHGRVIDLDKASFAALAPPSAGVLRVTVSWGNRLNEIALPATDTERTLHDWLEVVR